MKTDAPLRVLIVGATGVFGRRLAEQLVHEPGITLILAGRTAQTLAHLDTNLGNRTERAVLDRALVTAGDLQNLGVRLVIDAAGPFQESGTSLIEAAIEAGCHYVDLADGRAFVAGIGRFDAAARARGVTILSGASSTPALSHAAVDALTRGWRAVDTIRVAISPGNRAPRGVSVVRAVLSYAGQPIRLFRDGGWRIAPGWGLTHELDFPGIGRRTVSLCETPDMDLFVDRYRPRIAAEFFAGFESRLMHQGLRLAALLVLWRLIRSLAPYATPLHFIASLLQPYGTDRGGMVAQVTGQDRYGRPVAAQWSLAAEGGRGPFVPTLAALVLARHFRDGKITYRGAMPCAGTLAIEDFHADFQRLGIKTKIRRSNHARAETARETRRRSPAPINASTTQGPTTNKQAKALISGPPIIQATTQPAAAPPYSETQPNSKKRGNRKMLATIASG
ncbi:MAG: saccharopine dehydrogenase [Alphaproteobacteria bacterium]|nr:saccharopine dehydrogenase [Alphaproteobacteria bacterium]